MFDLLNQNWHNKEIHMAEVCEGCAQCMDVSYFPEQDIWLCGTCRDLGTETFDVDTLEKGSGIQPFLAKCKEYGFQKPEFYKSDKFTTFIIFDWIADFSTLKGIYFMKLEDGRGMLKISAAHGSVTIWSDKKARSTIR
jgi:hypothetical protein